MAITGTLFGMTKTKSEIDSVEIFKSMMLEVNASGAVVMDGRNIAAGSIYANQLSANSITANKIKAGEITTDHITTSGISANKIKAGELRATNGASWLNLDTGKFNFANGKIAWDGSTLTLSANTIKIGTTDVATTTQVQAVSDNLNNLETGFRNIIPNSSFESLMPKYSTVNGAVLSVSSDFAYDGTKSMKVVTSTTVSASGFSLYDMPTVIGNKYVASAMVYNPTATSFAVTTGIYESNWANPYSKAHTLKPGWNKVFIDFIATQTNTQRFAINALNRTYYVDCVQLVSGNKASDWTPAIEDMVSNSSIMQSIKDSPETVRMTGARMYFDNEVLFDSAFFTKLFAESAMITNLESKKIKAGQIDAGILDASKITTGTMSADRLVAGTITADKIKVGTITADRIQAATITADRLLANTITAREIGVGVITAQEIKAGAITVDKLSVGDFTNYAAWDKTSASFPLNIGYLDAAVYRSTKGSVRLAPGQVPAALKSSIEVVPGEEIYYEFWIKTDTTWNGTDSNSKIRIGNQVGTLLHAISYTGVKTAWTKYTGSYIVAVGVSTLTVSWGNDGSTGNVWIDDIVVKKKTNGQLIVDGSITADHITSTGITADKIKTGRLNATNGVSWIDLDNGQFSYGNGKITYNGSTLAVNVDSLQIRSQGVPTQIEAQGYADTAVSNLEIGGRNLWVDSNTIAGHNTSGAGTISGATANHQVMQQPISVTPNGNITYQVWNPKKIANGSNTNRISFFDANMVYLSQVQLLMLSGATYQTSLIKVPSTAYNARLGVIHGLNTGAKDSTIKFKFEKGDKATDWTPAPEDVDAIIAQAQTDATNAKNSAGVSTQLLADLSNDSVLTPVEKKSVKKEWDIIVSEKAKIDAEAVEYGITAAEKTTYNTHYTTLNTYITPLLSNLNANSTIVGTTFRTNFKNYYDARQDLLNAITTKSKSLADTAQSTANTAKTNAATAQTAADAAKSSIADMSSDSKITPVEKVQLKKEWAAINAERASIDGLAATYGITTERTNMTNSYNTLNTVLNGTGGILSNMTTTSTVVGATFRGQFDDYYDKKAILQRKASETARGLANGAQGTADVVKGVVSNFDSAIINANPIFLDWTGTLPAGYASNAAGTFAKVISGNGMGNALKYTVVAGANSYLNPTTITTFPYAQYISIEVTFKLESGTIDGAGVLFRYFATTNADFYIKLKDLVPAPVLNKWYTVNTMIKQATSPAGFTGYQMYPMGGWTSFGTVTAKVIQFDSMKARQSTEQEINAYESNIMISDMSSDSKITPVEKVQLKKEWATINAERASVDGMAATYGISTERTNMTNAYNTLNTVLNGSGGILTNMAITSVITGSTFRNQFDDYYDKKAILQRKINETSRTLANSAQSTANTANSSANTANSGVNSINGKINNAVTTIDATGVTVKDGSFFLEDNGTDTKYSVVAKANLIKDHSFEAITNFNDNVYNADMLSYKVSDQDLISQDSSWRAVGSPYIHNGYGRQYVSNLKEILLSQFGQQSATVNDTNYVIQPDILIRRGYTYTLSAFFKNHLDFASWGTPEFKVELFTAKGETIPIGTKTFPTLGDANYERSSRYSYTFTVPGTSYETSVYLKVAIKGANGYWVNVDGIQLVQSSYPVIYTPEETANRIITSPTYQSRRLPINTNLNNLFEEGNFFAQRDADAITMAGSPTILAFSLSIERHAGWKQTITNYQSANPKTWVRNYYFSTGWGAWKVIVGSPEWIGLSKKNGWGNYGGAFATPSYMKDANNVVHLRGMTDGGTKTSGVVLGTLPVGYRPENVEIFTGSAYGGTGHVQIYVNSSGDVSVSNVPAGWISLSGISFLSI